jgi:hypothetical protein
MYQGGDACQQQQQQQQQQHDTKGAMDVSNMQTGPQVSLDEGTDPSRAHHSVHSPCAGQSLAALANWQPQGLSPTVATSDAPVILAATAATTAATAAAAAAAAVVHLQA